MKTFAPQPSTLCSHHPNVRSPLRHLLCLLLAVVPLSAQTALTWDPAATKAGTQIYTHPNTNAGDYTFSVVAPAGSPAGMRFRLSVIAGNADLYVKQGSVPTTGSYGFASAVAGSDLIALNPSQYSTGQTWSILVKAFAGASWTLLAGDAAVALPWDPGTTDADSLPWNDHGNGVYDIGEIALPSGSGSVSIGPEAMRFFKAIVPTGTPAWSLWLNGDPHDLAVRNSLIPHAKFRPRISTRPGRSSIAVFHT